MTRIVNAGRVYTPPTAEELWKVSTTFMDLLPRELALNESQRQTVLRVCAGVWLDEMEFDEPDRRYDHVWARLNSYRAYLHKRYCAANRPEGLMCLECGAVGTAEAMA